MNFWTPESVEVLRRRWCDDGASAAVIAAEIGTTRCAVMGKMKRMGWQRGEERKNTKEVKARGKQPRTKRVRAKKPKPVTPPPPLGLTIFELRLDHCRWPLGELYERATLFCGRKPLEGRAYCKEHFTRGTIPSHRIHKHLRVAAE